MLFCVLSSWVETNMSKGLQKNSVFITMTGLYLKSPQEEEEQAPQVIQTSFTVKLNKFDAAKKVADRLLLY